MLCRGDPLAVDFRAPDIAGDDFADFVCIERFFEIVGRAVADGFLCGFERSKTGKHDDGDLLVNGADFFQALYAGFAGHFDVHDDGVRRIFFEFGHSFIDRIHAGHIVDILEKEAETFPRAKFIINYK